MKKILILSLLVVFVCSPVMAAKKVNLRGQKCEFPDIKSWGVCEADADCVVTVNVCGWLNAVNAKYAAEQEEYNYCMGPMVSCAEPDAGQKKDNTAAACVNKKCVIVPAAK